MQNEIPDGVNVIKFSNGSAVNDTCSQCGGSLACEDGLECWWADGDNKVCFQCLEDMLNECNWEAFQKTKDHDWFDTAVTWVAILVIVAYLIIINL